MKKFKMPHALVIMVMIILLAVVMTWIVPAGQFARIENAEGVKVVDPTSFQYLESSPVSLLKVPKMIVESLISKIDLMYTVIFAGAAFLYLIICAYIGSQGIHEDTGIICSLQVLVILVMKLYRICFCLEIRREKELQAMVKTQHMVENRERYERIQKENAYIMKSMHDLKKHVELLEQMKQGSPVVDDYRSDIIVKTEHMLNVQKTGDELIDKILQLYHPRFQVAGIRFQLESDVIDYSFMDPVDRCAVLCNMLDNALESCLDAKEPFILLRMVEQHSTILWKMKNSCTRMEQEKEDAFAHGFGMQNIRDIARRYQGTLSAGWERAHLLFRTTVTFDKPLMSENEPLM